MPEGGLKRRNITQHTLSRMLAYEHEGDLSASPSR